MRKIVYSIIGLFSIVLLQAQDPTYSQLFLSKNLINPAFAGYSEDFSFETISRLQWLNVPGGYVQNAFAVNAGCDEARLGFALVGQAGSRGEGILQDYNFAGSVSVNIPSRLSQKLRSRALRGKRIITSAGLSLGVGQRFLDWSRLTFTDQLDPFLGKVLNTSAVNPQNESSNLTFDMSAGLRSKLELGDKGTYLSGGFAIFHINRPVESFLNAESRMFRRYTAHAFIHLQQKKYMNTPQYFSIGAVSSYQGNTSTNLVSVHRDFGKMFMLGMGYRTENFWFMNGTTDAVFFQMVFKKNDWLFSYGYDITISSLGPQRTFGVHEVGIHYTFKQSAPCGGRRQKKGEDKCFYLNDGIRHNSDFNMHQP